jgi:hypothetical protein
MPGELIPIIAILMAFGAPAAVIIILAVLKHRQKMELARQGINPNASGPGYPGKGPLLWGMILSGLGIASIASSLYDTDHDLMRFGFLFLGAGVALLVYWFVSAPERKRAIQLYEEKLMAEQDYVPMRRPARPAPAPGPDQNDSMKSSES